MSHELICSWLGLGSGEWPPDHYRLLGLEPGEQNSALIEQRVHERLDTVRRYQMMHPEQATEAMNRLAQAFVCLTEPESKRAYDAELLGTESVAVATATAEPPPSRPDPLAWLYGPWPADNTSPPPVPPQLPAPAPAAVSAPLPPPLPPVPPPVPLAAPPAASEAAETPPAQAPEPPPSAPTAAEPPKPQEPVDPLVEAAEGRQARRGLASRRALYGRIAQTRILLREWDEVGRVLASQKRRTLRASDVRSLRKELQDFHARLSGFPKLLGEAGQPGYMVLALDALDDAEVLGMSAGQREAIARDWKAAQKLLLAHRDFLRREVRHQRRCNFRERLVRRFRAIISDQPAIFLLLLALVALNIAVWRSFSIGGSSAKRPPSSLAPPVHLRR